MLSKLVAAVIPSEENRLWNAWLDLQKREPRDLRQLLTSDVRTEFKARALIVLLAPDLHVLPFRWDDTDRSSRNYLFLRGLEVKTFPPELLSFAGELLVQNIDHARASEEDGVRHALVEYNDLILQFLAVLPEDDDLANRLFSRFQINDPFSYWNMDDASGYNPVRSILCAESIPNKWKVLADQQMRERIVAELEGRQHPREKWEGALRCYTDHIQMSNYDGREGYSRELLASQIRFITELQGIENYDGELFSSWQVAHILGAIPGEGLRKTRHKLSRLVVLREVEGRSEFSVCNPESRRAAEMILHEFGAEDQELSTALGSMIAEADRREAEAAETRREKQRVADEVMSAMK